MLYICMYGYLNGGVTKRVTKSAYYIGGVPRDDYKREATERVIISSRGVTIELSRGGLLKEGY